MALTASLLSAVNPARAESLGEEETLTAQQARKGQEKLPKSLRAPKKVKGVKAKIKVRRNLEFAGVKCRKSIYCPSGEHVLVQQDRKFVVKGRIAERHQLAKQVLRLESAAIKEGGVLGKWTRLAKAKYNEKGKFKTKTKLTEGRHVVRLRHPGFTRKWRAAGVTNKAGQALAHVQVSGVNMLRLDYVNQTKDNSLSRCHCGSSKVAPAMAAIPATKPPFWRWVTRRATHRRCLPCTWTREIGITGFTVQEVKNDGSYGSTTWRPDWTGGPNKTNCANANPYQGSTPGTEWTVTIQNSLNGWNGWLDGPGMPETKKNPPGCNFDILTSFGMWFANMSVVGWLEVALVTAAVVVAVVAVGWALFPVAEIAADGAVEATVDVTVDAAAESGVSETVTVEGANDVMIDPSEIAGDSAGFFNDSFEYMTVEW